MSTIVSFLSFNLNSKAKYCVASGSFGQITNFWEEKKKIEILLPSGDIKFFSLSTVCYVGRSNNFQKKHCITGKAGINSNLGIRPTVRGNAMNPIDHPHGGRAKTNKPEVSPWGWVAKHNK